MPVWIKIYGIFLILHGVVHALLSIAPRPGETTQRIFSFFTSRSWLLERMGANAQSIRRMGIFLVALSMVLLIAAGILLLSGGIWRGFSIAAALVSMLLLGTFWQRMLPVGVALDVLVIILALTLR